MQHWYYMIFLLVALAGVACGDYAKKLALFWDFKRSSKIIGISVLFFLVWDIVGVGLSVFSTNRAWVSGIYLYTPNLPIEELLFLTFLSYITLVAWRLVCTRTR